MQAMCENQSKKIPTKPSKHKKLAKLQNIGKLNVAIYKCGWKEGGDSNQIALEN